MEEGSLISLARLTAQLSKGEHCQKGVVQVQNGAPVDLLIGTDLQPHLGFLFLESRQKGASAGTDLLSGKAWKLSVPEPQPHTPQLREATDPVSTLHEEPLVLRLVHATRLPARHAKLVRARMDGLLEDKSFILFEPSTKMRGARGLQMEDGAAELDENGFLTLAVLNYNLEPVCLEEGLGCIGTKVRGWSSTSYCLC